MIKLLKYDQPLLLMHSSKEKNCEYCGKLFLKKGTTVKCCSVSCGHKKYFENLEAREKQSQVIKKYFEAPGAREKQSQAIKKYFETPGAREKNSQAQKKRFENPEEQEKHNKRMKECHETLEAREKASQAKIKYFENPEAREKQSQALKKHYENPEAREKISQTQINKRSCFYILDQMVNNDYCFRWTEKLRIKIRTRDNFICMECGKVQEKRKLSVHHVHYDKKNCYPDLITLCTSCHSKANFNRDYWENRFMNKINDLGLLFWLHYI